MKADSASEVAVETAKRWEGFDSVEDAPEPLEVKVVASLDGEARIVRMVTTTGGPHVEVNLSNGVVRVSWGGESHTVHFSNDDVREALLQRFLQQWGANVDGGGV